MRSESLLRVLRRQHAGGLSGAASTAAHAERSARRTTVRGLVQQRRERTAAGQDERIEVGQRLAVRVAPVFERVDVGLFDAQRRILGDSTTGVDRSAPASNRSFCTVRSTVTISAGRAPAHASATRWWRWPRRSRHRRRLGVGLRDAREVAESGAPVVAGAGVDTGQMYGHGCKSIVAFGSARCRRLRCERGRSVLGERWGTTGG